MDKIDDNTKKMLLTAAVAAAVYFMFFHAKPSNSNSMYETFEGRHHSHPHHHHHHVHERIPDAAGTRDLYAPAFPS